MSRGQSQPRTQSGRRTLERCKEKDRNDSVVFIDVDTANIIILDVPESSQPSPRGTLISGKDKSIPSSSVISIDDDEICNDGSPRNGVEGCGDGDSDATSSKMSRHASNQLHNSDESDGDECQFIWERKFPVKLSKCKRTYSGKTVPRNCFTQNSVSESCSESDNSDCELMEDSFGNIREQWEKASLKKKGMEGVQHGKFGTQDQASSSGSHTDSQKNVGVENKANHPAQSPVHSSSSNGYDERVKISTSVTNGVTEGTSCKPTGKKLVDDLDRMLDKEKQFSQREDGFQGRRFGHVRACPQDGEASIAKEPCWFNTQSVDQADFIHRNVSVQDKKAYFQNIQHFEQVDNETVVCWEKDDKFDEQSPSYNQSSNDTKNQRASFEEEPVSGEQCFCKVQPCCGAGLDHDLAFSVDNGGPTFGMFSCNSQMNDELEVNHDKANCQDKGKAFVEETSMCKTRQNEKQDNRMDGNQPHDERNPPLHMQDGDGTLDVQNYIIGKREKLKETDEYKHAAEEEWASRQRELKVQAEEAQRLRKRKRAETMRLLDMERRQKQRVEEMRETQKKDEETINLKEQLRVEVRRELEKLEGRYTDMASLLRGLGIQVGGGLFPLSHEVHAAYKQALLRFHPDRASRTDIRQQVEAEEKFKLISRLKEKLLLTA
ncbi:PREDICTED: uncharacterized protein LOC104597876 isoform X2 [Nelumbo nucifera]|nr:PREDICTED: uncharacterized protein LOC104597876 isoform X2 [Nelumbo nucifera]